MIRGLAALVLLAAFLGCSGPEENFDGCEHIARNELVIYSNNVGIFPE